jgi:peptidyl-dipeptidase Dcp
MLARNWRWGSSVAVQIQILTVRAFQTCYSSTQAHRHLPAFFRDTKSFPVALTALSVSTSTSDEVPTISTKAGNPLLRSWSDQPFHLPPFKSIEPSHFEPALEAGMEAHINDLEAIVSSSSNDFDSILGAYDRAGSLYSKIASVYGNYISSLNIPDMQAVQTKMAPILSRHRSKCYNVPGLFAKIEKMHAMREEMLERGEWNAEQARLAERVYIGFERMGAKLSEEGKKEYADIQGETFFD